MKFWSSDITSKPLAFVLGGGGARGALQVGALRAFLEAGYQPDMLVGTSIGAVNAAYLALRGFNLDGLEALEKAWQAASQADLLPSNYLWLTIRALFNRSSGQLSTRMRDFFLANGLDPNMRFADINDIKLYIVAADLNSHQTQIFGGDPEQSVLEAVLASTAIPPWISPLAVNDRWMMDGGAVSPLPVEPAMQAGAEEIFAFDLTDPRQTIADKHSFGTFLNRLIFTVELRQIELELALARARRVRVQRVLLHSNQPVNLWDFSHTEQLVSEGYDLGKRALEEIQAGRPGISRWLHSMVDKWKKLVRR